MFGISKLLIRQSIGSILNVFLCLIYFFLFKIENKLMKLKINDNIKLQYRNAIIRKVWEFDKGRGIKI